MKSGGKPPHSQTGRSVEQVPVARESAARFGGNQDVPVGGGSKAGWLPGWLALPPRLFFLKADPALEIQRKLARELAPAAAGQMQGVGADSSSFRMRCWPLEWKVPPAPVLASFIGFSGGELVISVGQAGVERAFSTEDRSTVK